MHRREATPPVHPDGLPVPQRYASVLAIAIGIGMSVLDATVANIALPTIARHLDAAPAVSIWIVNAYQLIIVASLLPLAALGERVGYRRVHVVGMAVFTAGSLACALSHSLPTLIASRALQGLGGAGMMSVNGALVRFTYPQASLGQGIGLNALVVAIAAAIGPTVASAILAVASWEWLFAVNVPIGALGLMLAARALPHSERSRHPFDLSSAGLNAIAFGLFFVGADTITHGRGAGWIAALEVAAALAAGIILVRREKASTAPLIPIDLMRVPIFAMSVAASVCAFAAYILAFLALPFYFETVLHRGQVQTGLLMTPWPVALGLIAPVAGRLSDRVSAAILGGAGMAVLAVGLVLLATLPQQPSTSGIVWRVALAGFGFGIFQSPNNRTLLSSAPRERAGAAGGMLATARLTGLTVGAALTAMAFHLAPHGAETVALLTAAGLAVAAGAASLLRATQARGRGASP